MNLFERIVFQTYLIITPGLLAQAQDWTQPYFDPSELAQNFSAEERKVAFYFDENVEPNNTLGELIYKNSNKPAIKGTDRFKIEVATDGKFVLQNVVAIDYEKITKISFRITAGTVTVNFDVFINNLNDNPMYIVLPSEPCIVMEEEDPHITNCSYKITDEDGISEEIDISNVTESAFIMAWEGNYIGEKSANVSLNTITKLDYETKQLYIFSWFVSDETNFTDSATIVVNVDDAPDMPPVWTTIWATQQFDEHLDKEFYVAAVDGDTKINAKIGYKCLNIPQNLETVIQCVTYENKEGFYINITNLDRDEENINTVNFEIMAIEEIKPYFNVTQGITFIINDINDNVPKIDTDKATININENEYTNLDDHIKIEIEDKDLADFATYNVKLLSAVDNFTAAVQIVPTIGYQRAKFSLVITDASLLDYDRTDAMRDFHFEIVPTEVVESGYTVENKKINMKLINWNDEKPIFVREDYEVEIEETVGRKGPEILLIPDLYANDADYGDEVIYQLLGRAVDNILEIIDVKPPSGENVTIQTKQQASENVQIFDYERGDEVIIQLKARDNFPHSSITNTAITQVTIKLLDVNDETPSILITQQSTRLDENVVDGTIITTGNQFNTSIEINVIDEDTDAELNVYIDWDESNPTKNGVKLDWENKLEIYKGCIILEEINPGPHRRNGTYIMKTIETAKNNTPDFELFDTINLKIVVNDTKQVVGEGKASLMFVINVNNINDCPPIFVQSTIDSNKTVMEHSIIGLTIATIRALDEDGDDIHYHIDSGNCTEFVNIDETSGEITVLKEIDADLPVCKGFPKLYALNLTVRASDGKFEDAADITIAISDYNELFPFFVNSLTDIFIEEHSEIGTSVIEVPTNDLDRDYPNNGIKYSLRDQPINKYIEIDENNGTITIKDEGLDRDHGNPLEYEVVIDIKDNPTSNGVHNANSTSFKLILIDINDNAPIINTTTLPKIDEQIKKGGEVGVIEAYDADEIGNDNSKIKFKILSVTTVLGKNNLTEDDFEINTDAEFTSWKGTIKAKIPLKDYYGEFLLEILAEDLGKPPRYSTKKISLTIDKYNFNPPKFIFPNESTISLKMGIGIGKKLVTSYGHNLPPFKAESDPSEKYNAKINLMDFTHIFELKPTGHLQYIAIPDEKREYELTLMAIDDGSPSLSSEIKVTIKFRDLDVEPSYKINDISVYFDELICDDTVPTATADVNADKVSYHLFEDPSNAFSVDGITGDLTINKCLVRENFTDPFIKIAATNYDKFPTNPSINSTLNVKVELQSVNYRPPEFLSDKYFGGITTLYDIDKKILKIEARDKDENDTLTYSILDESLEAIGEGITTSNKFNLKEIDKDSADIELGFQVKSNMHGHFRFIAQVFDGLHTTNTTVTIFIISQNLHIVDINFDNNINEVQEKRDEIGEIFTRVLNVQCVINDVVKATDDKGIEIDTSTQVRMHFIKDNLPVNANEMFDKIMELTNYKSLIRELTKENLIINRVEQAQNPTKEEDINDTLMIWLITVSVVLGSLCVILIVALILRTRSLTTRLNKLSTTKFESMASNLNVDAVPTSNRNAVEGSNPIYQINANQNKIEFDRESISSGESDLIGIENNPTFAKNSDDFLGFGGSLPTPNAPVFPDLDDFL